MKLLYVASDQRVPGATGGSVHVEEVARGLSALGHELHVVGLAGNGAAPPFELHEPRLLLPHRFFRWSAKGTVAQLIETLGIDAVMERYYNFGGEGIRAAHEHDVPSLLEVNSPLSDYPGSLKGALDKLALVRPMRRLRMEICRKAGALVTPLPAIVPESVPREKVHRVSWGANVDRFHPEVPPASLGIPEGRVVAVFAGSFRPWHGADVLVRAAALVSKGPKKDRAFFLFLGWGPSWEASKALARQLGIETQCLFVGSVSYEEMPAHLRCAHIGVAPYQPARLGEMRLGFYWSPLKIFEYMATGLPVVTLDVPPLREVVRAGKEGLFVGENDPEGLARALETLIGDREKAEAMGRSGRERVAAHYSWQRHCEQLNTILAGLVEGG